MHMDTKVVVVHQHCNGLRGAMSGAAVAAACTLSLLGGGCGSEEVEDAEGFGHCTNHGECERACPKGINLRFIAMMNRELLAATTSAKTPVAAMG